MDDLRRRTLRGGLAKLLGQGLSVIARLAFMAVLARLLDPSEFGLVAMATAVTGMMAMLASAGLSTAVVQARSISDTQLSTLFWINILIGAWLAAACGVLAPILVSFYGEPRLFWLTILLAPGFLLSAASVQQLAILQRSMRYGALTIIEFVGQLLGLLAGVVLALAGYRYWALVGANLFLQLGTAIGLWMATGWLPRWRFAWREVIPFLRVGGTNTLNTIVTYLGFNLEKILIGRVWGAEALGHYGRAYQLISVPIDNLSNAVGSVAFSALSRLQDDPERLRAYFLKGYALLVSLSLPLTLFLGLFAEPIFLVLFGPKWREAAVIFQILTPTLLVFSLTNPFGWLLLATGRQNRSFRIALVMAGLVVGACIAGLPHGPRGVAAAYSAAMMLWFLPHIVWSAHGGPVTPRDIVPAILRPLAASGAALAATLLVERLAGARPGPIGELVQGGGVMLLVYGGMMFLVLGQGRFYLGLIRGLRQATPMT
ncbi:lipopolysaccharide biosynthesis protein [Kaistia adipata]|uniref:lipopolysaccharide biosynthesis protein n=1 Tax=Kaistia adipata TaxID=166954 RepID=UPI0003FC7E6A|nr:lipopolysaccharide biosynthesis protein [Kaistia adipata]